MKVLLLKDVYKLGRAGDVKKVADGYGRNFLIPQNLAVIASVGALKQIEHIRAKANAQRLELNSQMGSVAEKVAGLSLFFASKAGETGKLYGSITSQMIADAINKKLGTEIDRHIIEVQPIRTLGEHKASVRLTMDLTPEVKIFVHREGENPENQAKAKVVEETQPPASQEVAAAAEEKTE
jgi:large subunit ribosomal protein L9